VNPWFAIARDAGRLAIEAQSVVALRLARLARGGKRGSAEARRMIVEKAEALGEANAAAARSLISGDHPSVTTRKAMQVYGKRVSRNRRRLTPRWWRWW
jgi:hypothetical protein